MSIHATLALQHTRPSIHTLLSPLNSTLDDFQSNACGLGIDYGPDIEVGLIPDLNMFDRPDVSHPGVNPLDTIQGTAAQQSPSPRVIQDIMSILVQPPWSEPAQRFSPLQLPVKLESTPTNISGDQHPSSTHSSPVLNAHLGIDLTELISRAERFRTKHPERDIDRAWLSHFAGKLSDRGELLNDFRCYVVGCDQRNKRRDHILVHVGAHIGQRPFACSVCPLRFLRKNECKRHEASHTGFRPYSCDICGQSFVRQDLVKRHVKRTHGMRDENNEPTPSRKRARLQ